LLASRYVLLKSRKGENIIPTDTKRIEKGSIRVYDAGESGSFNETLTNLLNSSGVAFKGEDRCKDKQIRQCGEYSNTFTVSFCLCATASVPTNECNFGFDILQRKYLIGKIADSNGVNSSMALLNCGLFSF
jgi:hypothetical protein